MKPTTKKYLIAGTIAILSITCAMFYLQYRKLMNYVIKLKSIKVNQITLNNFNLDLFINFTNNSDIKIEISEQVYKVYLNDKFVTKLSNKGLTVIAPKSTSVLPINVHFNPNDVLKLLGQNFTAILLQPEKINLKIDIKLKVSLYGIKVSIPMLIEKTLKDILDAKKNKNVE